jgi:hypothetical protein
MTSIATESGAKIEDFSDDEIRKEYEERFGEEEDASLDDFEASDMIEWLEDRGAMPDPEPVPAEIVDLIAEAARTSAHARRAYDLLTREEFGVHDTLAARQRLIRGRMREVML